MARRSKSDTQQERFCRSVQENLPDIARELLALESDPADRDRLEKILGQIRLVKKSAGEVGQDKVGRLADLLEECLVALQAGTVRFSGELNELLIQAIDLVDDLVTSDPDWQPDLEHTDVVSTLQEVLAMARAAAMETGSARQTSQSSVRMLEYAPEEWPIGTADEAAEPESDEWPLDPHDVGSPGPPPIQDERPVRGAAPELTVHQREFLAEVPERIQHMTESILALEHAATDPEAINAVFRLGHNLKGEGAMLGFPIISKLGHEMENLLVRIRDQQVTINPDIIDTLFACVDTLKQLVEAAKAGTLDQTQHLPVVDRLQQHLPSVGEKSPLSSPLPAAAAGERAPAPDWLLARPETLQPRIATPGKWTARVPKAEEPEPLTTPKMSPKPPEAPAAPRSPAARVEEAIRVNLSKLDTLINLASELLIDRSAEEEKLTRLAKAIDMAKGISRRWEQLKEDIHVDRSLRPFLRHPKVSQLLNMTGQLVAQVSGDLSLIFEDFHVGKLRSSLVIDRLQEEVMKVRMLPVGTVFNTFPRVVRDIARSRDKQVQLLIQGESTELDKRILEEIEAPLMHIIRNAVDHGLEPAAERLHLGKAPLGTIHLRAFHSGNQVAILIEDDGRGLDLKKMRMVVVRKGLMTPEEAEALSDYEATQLMFRPGFSTADVVTDISGRGVGMDVVMTNIKKIKGTLEVESRLGLGTRFVIKLPLTLAIVEALMVQSRSHTFYIPTTAVEEILTLARGDVFTADGRKAMDFRGNTIPLVWLAEILRLPGEDKERAKRDVLSLVILRAGEAGMAFAVDRVVKVQDIVIKTMGSLLRQVPNVAGATILGSGEVAVILDVPSLISGAHRALGYVAPVEEAGGAMAPEPEAPPYILVVEDSLSTRELIKSILETTGHQVRTAVDGVDALAKIREEKPRLIVADVEMPRLDGFELTRTIRQDGELRDIPIIITTVHDKEEDRRKGLRAGANAYIVKGSFDQRNLLTAVEELMGP